MILPEGNSSISDMFAYNEGGIWFCGAKTRFDLGEVICGFGGWVNGFVTLDTPTSEDPGKSYEEGDGWESDEEGVNACDKGVGRMNIWNAQLG